MSAWAIGPFWDVHQAGAGTSEKDAHQSIRRPPESSTSQDQFVMSSDIFPDADSLS